MPAPTLTRLDQLKFDHRFVETLPADPSLENRSRPVRNACFSFVDPTPVSNPSLVACSAEMLRELDLDESACHDAGFVQVLSGNRLLPQMRSYATCYGGHQFGQWAGQLGDGRAILLGDVVNHGGQRWSLQLKGAGPTPYSRRADGLAVLRSSLREFVCSEAMHHLGVPTTRALSLVLTGESVVRDMFYDGNPRHEPGAVVCRVAPSFTRFGNFQILTAQQDFETLQRLLDYTIETDFTHLGAPSRDVYIEWFNEVCSRTVEMIVHWMRVGFVHGVMNTDNMSVLGLTIDYGPYGWLEDYDPDWTPNTTDANGRRYRFGHQPMIAQWNLVQLAEAILPLIGDSVPLEQALERYHDDFVREYDRMMAAKLGFDHYSDAIASLVKDQLSLMARVETDMTLFYRALADLDLTGRTEIDGGYLARVFKPAWYREEQLDEKYLRDLYHWIEYYRNCAHLSGLKERDRRAAMNRINPKYVFRNYLAQQAIDQAEQGEYDLLHDLMKVLKQPYDEQPEMERFAEKRPEWARHRAGCSMLSCSS